MQKQMQRFMTLLLVILLMSAVSVISAQDDDAGDEMPMAEITNDEGGVQIVKGEVNFTVGYLTDFNRGLTNIVLTNDAYYIDKIYDEATPNAWQVFGQVTSDVYTSPFTYELYLPIVPRGPLRDVDNDGAEDTGIALASVSGYINLLGEPYWDQDFEYGTGFTSYQTSTEYARLYDIIGGKMLIWSPDDAQGFPSGFGEDGSLFTEDDPIMGVPAGWSVVNMDAEPFTLDRSTSATVDLLEQEQSLQPADYTTLTYSEAFTALVDQMRQEYAFTEFKGVDWDALYEEYYPRFVEAEENADSVAYQMALTEFGWEIPDGHVGASAPLTNDAFFAETDGSIGIAIRQLDDGRIIVNYLVEGSPAAEAGLLLGAELTAINGEPPLDRADDINIWSSPFSTEHSLVLQQLRYITRFLVGEEVEISFINPDETEEQTATLTAYTERESWSFSSANNGAAGVDELPITYEVLDSGYAYVRINTFSAYPEVMFRLWEWIIDQLNANNIPGLILDMRWNGGGYNIDTQLAGYFFQEPVVVGNSADFYPDLGDFYIDPNAEVEILPSADGRYYGGPIALLVSPACASACEFFSYDMTLNDRATVVGFYPSTGLGGNITPVYMPDGVYFQFTVGRALDAEGNIRFEGTGIVPDILVPVTEETLFAEGDVVLQYAEAYLDEATSIPVTDAGEILIGDSLAGTLVEGERVQYTFNVPTEGGLYDVIITSEDATLDTVLYIYIAPDLSTPVFENDDFVPGEVYTSGVEELEVPGGLSLVIEVAGYGDAVAGDFTITLTETGS